MLGAAVEGRRPDPVLIAALRAAHRLLGTDRDGRPVLDAAPASSHHRRLIRLAFLAPDLQRAILAGEKPRGLTLAALMEGDLPASWARQRQMFDALSQATAHRSACER